MAHSYLMAVVPNGMSSTATVAIAAAIKMAPVGASTSPTSPSASNASTGKAFGEATDCFGPMRRVGGRAEPQVFTLAFRAGRIDADASITSTFWVYTVRGRRARRDTHQFSNFLPSTPDSEFGRTSLGVNGTSSAFDCCDLLHARLNAGTPC